MDIDYLKKLIVNPAISSPDDLSDLNDLAMKYPYCQIIHIIVAIIHRDHDLEAKEKFLSQAALRTPDRKILKKIIEHQIDLSARPDLTPQEPAEELSPSLSESKEEHSFEKPDQEDSNNDESPADNPHFETNHAQEYQPDKKIADGTANSGEKHDQPPVEKRGFIEELSQEVMNNLEKVQKVMFKYNEKEKEFEQYLEDLKEQKEESSRNFDVILNYLDEVEPESKAQKLEPKEQLELIDRFIATEHTLHKKPRPQDTVEEAQEDLSEGSTKIDENLVSENLALIMKKQGKIDKAIDIYKKLIWKFPQKKTYFASQIEALEKK